MSENTGDMGNANVASSGGGLLRRVKDHRLAQWTVAYVGLAYAIQHAVVLTGEAFEWPQLIQRVTMLLLVLGLPLMMTLAWYHGGKANTRITGPELSIMAILLVGVAILFYVFVRPENTASKVREAGITAARQAASDAKGAISIAVLPFLDLSPEKDQDYFSDGMTEEITTALAKVADLRVVGRTSAFQFKNNNGDLRAIGQALAATHLIEGSVRKAGNRLRITAQLIKADDGTHVWAEDYDREMTDVFQIQEDIARAITTSLRMPLGLKPGESLVNNRNIDPDSYAQYLRARGIFASRQVGGNAQQATRTAITLLEEVVARSPSYSPAWTYLSASYSLLAQIHAQSTTESQDQSRAAIAELRIKGEAAAKRAVETDPEYPGAYTMLGVFAWSRGHLLEANAALQKSLLLNPDSEQLAAYADRLADAGLVKEAATLWERAHAQDSLVPPATNGAAFGRWLNGDDTGAIALAKTLPANLGAPLLTGIFASQGQYQNAADALTQIAGDANSPVSRSAELLRKRPAAIPAASIPSVPTTNLLRYVYPGLGAWNRTIASAERQFDVGYLGGRNLSPLWHPSNAPARRSEQFKRVVRKVGLVDFWRAKGWPPQCHPTTGDDFVCS